MDADEQRVIWKFNLSPDTPVFLPQEHRILHVGHQHGVPMLWAEVNPKSPRIPKDLIAAPTGGASPTKGQYLGTVVGIAGGLVYHFYDLEG